jgi:hypothetical protein
MARDSHVRERLFFALEIYDNGRFLAGMPDDDLLQQPIVGSEGGGEEISSCCRCAIQGFQEKGAVHVSECVVHWYLIE